MSIDEFSTDAGGLGRKSRTQIELEHRANEEMGGTARARRFVPFDRDPESTRERRERQSFDIQLTALQIMMQDPGYAAAYESYCGFVDRVGDAIKRARRTLDSQIDLLEEELEDLEFRAPKLPNGEAVFRDKDGKAFTENGRQLSAAELALITWPDDAPLYEDYLDTRQRLDEARVERDAVDAYERDVLTPAKVRAQNEDEPISQTDMDRSTKEIESQMPEQVRLELEALGAAKPAPESKLAASSFDMPTLK